MTVAERFDHIILVVSLCSLGAMMIIALCGLVMGLTLSGTKTHVKGFWS